MPTNTTKSPAESQANDTPNAPQSAAPVNDYESQRAADLAAARPALARAAWELADHDVIRLFEFLEIVNANLGSTVTPIEAGIIDIVFHWRISARCGSPMTPDDIIDCVDGPDGLRPDFDDCVKSARFFSVNYAELLAKPEQTEAEGVV